MQDWVAASDLVSYLEHAEYRNNTPFVYVRVKTGGFGNFVKEASLLKVISKRKQILPDHTSTFLRPQVT